MIATEPPASPALPTLDRRSLMKGGVLGAGLLASPLAAQASFAGFTHGVASGEPGAERVLLWTRFAAGQDTKLEWQVSESADFSSTVAAGDAIASPARDGCCKVWAEGLRPATWYYFRFIAPNGTVSDTGRTRTLPQGPTERFRLGVFSCSNIGFGWFNAYAHLAEADDVDCVYHAGDYFYEYEPGTYPAADQGVPGRFPLPASETVALADYRARHAFYRRDPDLRRLHQMFPVIAGWDDHESANDSWKGGAQNHQSDSEGPWDVRKKAAMQAYREWLPVSDNPWETYEIGDLATLFRLETRLEARAEQLSLAEILSGNDTGDEALSALAAFRDGPYADPSREVLGAAQLEWLAAGLKRSRGSGKTWQVLAQQVLMGELFTPIALTEALSDKVPDYVRKRLFAGAMATRAGIPLNMDAWDGYPAARSRVFAAALEAEANFVSLAGDTHNAWAFELAEGKQRVGVEFGGQSVTSPGFESYLTTVAPRDLAGALVQQNDQLIWADSSQRGYFRLELTPEKATSEYRFVSGIRQRATALAGKRRISSVAGSHRLSLG